MKRYRVVDPKAWLALAGLGILIAAAVIWAFVGTVSTTVPGQGVLSPAAGVGCHCHARCGAIHCYFGRGERLCKPRSSGTHNSFPPVEQSYSPVTAPFEGRVIEIRQRQGDVVNRGTVLLTVELVQLEGAHELEALVFVPATLGAQIKKGMSAQVSPVAGIESSNTAFYRVRSET